MYQLNKKGLFIVIDGTDGSGKTTQTEKLIDYLKGERFEVEMADFPQYGQASAAMVSEYLNGKYGTAQEVGPYRASIFYACDRYAAAPKIREWLSQGKVVITNRYVSANMGHQAGKIKNTAERDKYLEWLENLEYRIFNIPRPDINILLYVPPAIGQQLVDKKEVRGYLDGKKRDIHEADLEHLNSAAESYRYCANKYGWLTIDCAPNNELMTIDSIHQILKDRVEKIIKSS